MTINGSTFVSNSLEWAEAIAHCAGTVSQFKYQLCAFCNNTAPTGTTISQRYTITAIAGGLQIAAQR
jgi:hypothetical protein